MAIEADAIQPAMEQISVFIAHRDCHRAQGRNGSFETGPVPDRAALPRSSNRSSLHVQASKNAQN